MSELIGKKLKQLRKSKGLTQEEVAYKANLSRSSLSNYEIGRRTPHLKDLSKLATVFGVGLDFFGIGKKDDAFELLNRAKEIFQSENVSRETKEKLYREFMKLYLEMERED